MDYQATLESIQQHPLPKWFEDAKFGIFIHWGTYSIPGWAPTGYGVQDLIAGDTNSTESPYAEWYWSNSQQANSLTKEWQDKTYGAEFKYEQFAPMFNQAAQQWDPNDWAALFKQVGARYVVLTTKHHEGFCLWNSAQANPNRANYFSARDIVGELTNAVRGQGLRMGLYYSGGLDWTFKPLPITGMLGTLFAMPQDAAYVDYSTAQFKELVARYAPSVLWNDIGMPDNADVLGIFADYYNHLPEGVVNNRWGQYHVKDLPPEYLTPEGRQKLEEEITRAFASGVIGGSLHSDFDTPEYATYDKIVPKKWETTRGIGHSFGYNRNETAQDYTAVPDLVRLLVDAVSKNGNLLLNVGPMADGTIPALQRERLLGLGTWLAANGPAIFETRPWTRAEGTAQADGQEFPLRFTQRDNAVYATLLGLPSARQVRLRDLNVPVQTVELLGHPSPLAWQAEGNDLLVQLADDLPAAAQTGGALSLKISASR